MASLRPTWRRLAIPLLAVPARATTAEALETIRGWSSPLLVLQGQRAGFADCRSPAENVSAGVCGVSVAACSTASAAPLPPSDLTGPPGAGWRLGPSWLPAQQPIQRPTQRMAIHAAPSPSAAMKATALARLQELRVRLAPASELQGQAATNWWARSFCARSSPLPGDRVALVRPDLARS